MTRLSEMQLVSRESKYKHGQGTFVHVFQNCPLRATGPLCATVWVADISGMSIDADVAHEYVKLLAPGAKVDRRGTTFEVTPASALFEEQPCHMQS